MICAKQAEIYERSLSTTNYVRHVVISTSLSIHKKPPEYITFWGKFNRKFSKIDHFCKEKKMLTIEKHSSLLKA
jgi:hypothetical protein